MKTERQKYILKYEYDLFIKNSPEKYQLFWKVVAFGGLRISEALLIKINDIIYTENKILITTLKRINHPVIPIIFPKDIIDELRIYVEESGSMRKNLEVCGRIWKYSRQFCWKLFKSICKKAGLDTHYSPHSLRHFAGIMISDITNGNMIEIKNRLRHASIKSTEFYIHVSEKKQKELSNKIEEYMK